MDVKKSATEALEEQLGRTQNPQEATPDGNGTQNVYQDINAQKEDYSPNPQGLNNTGSGAEAAIGTQYSWEKQGNEKAQASYSTDVLSTKQQALTNRQTIENNAVNYQAEADMMKYQNNQNAEKVGWTGGYVLDQNRQMDYLKASIQAQMYGAMELQKYGHDAGLAAARLSYDLNKTEYAKQYYNEAVSAALSEAQLTGTYFSAETKDMMSQLSVAEQKLEDTTLSEADHEQAQKIKDSIYKWFSTNGISTQGVKTLEAYVQDQNMELQWSNELYSRYNAAVASLKQEQELNPNTFFMVDASGNPIFDGVDVKTIDFASTSIKDALDYVIQDGKISSQTAKEQLYSYFNWYINDAIAKYKSSVAKKDENGATTYSINQKDLKEVFEKAVDEVKKYQNDPAAKGLLSDYSYTLTGTTDVNATYDADNGIQFTANENSGNVLPKWTAQSYNSGNAALGNVRINGGNYEVRSTFNNSILKEDDEFSLSFNGMNYKFRCEDPDGDQANYCMNKTNIQNLGVGQIGFAYEQDGKDLDLFVKTSEGKILYLDSNGYNNMSKEGAFLYMGAIQTYLQQLVATAKSNGSADPLGEVSNYLGIQRIPDEQDFGIYAVKNGSKYYLWFNGGLYFYDESGSDSSLCKYKDMKLEDLKEDLNSDSGKYKYAS